MEQGLFNNYEINKINWNDKIQVIKALQKNGLNLCKCGEALKKDKEICLQAMDSDPFAYLFIDESLKGDLDIATTVLSRNGWMYTKMPQKIKNNSRIMKLAFNANKNLLKLSLKLNKNKYLNMNLDDLKNAEDKLKFEVLNDLLLLKVKAPSSVNENINTPLNMEKKSTFEKEYSTDREL